MSDLHPLRTQLDAVDQHLIEALAERQRLVTEVAALKSEVETTPLRDPARERDVLARLHGLAEAEGLDGYFVTALYRQIFDHSVRFQSARQKDEGVASLVVAYQGVDGCYSHAAAQHHFSAAPASVRYHGYPTFREAADAVTRKEADYAVLPVENTTAGRVDGTYDLLLHTDLALVGEEVHRVDHCLLAIEPVPLGLIRRVASHPQALAQCSTFLDGLRDCHVEVAEDTAGAARAVAESGDLSRAAIASEAAAQRYGLHIIKRGIANRKANYTRFVILHREPATFDPRMPHKTSLLLTLVHEHGALAEALAAFAAHDVNLTSLESRPSPEQPWQYRFFVDVEGGPHEPHVARALETVRRHVVSMQVLGAYPRCAREGKDEDPTARAVYRAEPAVASVVPEAPAVQVEIPSKYRLASRAHHPEDTVVEVGEAVIGGEAPVLIAGPCSVESQQQILACARAVREAGGHLLRGGCFKPRTSPYDFQGLGYEGLTLLREAGHAYGLPVVTEVLHTSDVEAVAREADVLQIGARNMQNFALLKAVGQTRVPVLLKRGMMASIDEWLAAAEYVLAQGNERVVLCERGIRTFETATRNTLDLSSVIVLRERTHLPVIVDPSHAAGVRRWVPALTKAALAAGAHGVMIEMHPDPEEALSDGPQSLTFDQFEGLARDLMGQPVAGLAA